MIVTKDEDYERYLRYLNNYREFEMFNNCYSTEYMYNNKYQGIIRKYRLNKLLDEESFENKMAKICRFIYLFVPANKPLVENPCDYNGFELLDYCLSGHSLNCTGYSIVLNDLLITLKIKSKCIWGLSHIMGDEECHAFNHVYNEKDKKWIIVDSAFGCVPCNNDNQGLNIIEFRNAITDEDDMKLIKSPNVFHDADYLVHYRRYLSKNFFMFLTLPNSGLEYSTQNGILVKPHNFKISNNFGNLYLSENAFYFFS